MREILLDGLRIALEEYADTIPGASARTELQKVIDAYVETLMEDVFKGATTSEKVAPLQSLFRGEQDGTVPIDPTGLVYPYPQRCLIAQSVVKALGGKMFSIPALMVLPTLLRDPHYGISIELVCKTLVRALSYQEAVPF